MFSRMYRFKLIRFLYWRLRYFVSFVKRNTIKKEHRITHLDGRGRLYPEKVFYLVRFDYTISGIASVAVAALNKIKKAVDRGYIPIVFYGDEYNIYSNTYCDSLFMNKRKCDNVWEWYFEQPTHYGLQVLNSARNIIYGDQTTNEWDYFTHVNNNSFLYDFSKYKEACLLFERFIHISQRILKKCTLLPEKAKILGVSYRRYVAVNDTKIDRWINSVDFIQPNLKNTLDKAKEVFEQGGYDYIFLHSSDEAAAKTFQNLWGRQCIIFDRIRSDNTDSTPSDYTKRYGDNPYENGEGYIIEEVLLSRCESLIGGINGGTIFSILLNNMQYKNVFLFNAGSFSSYNSSELIEILKWCADDEAQMPRHVRSKNSDGFDSLEEIWAV